MAIPAAVGLFSPCIDAMVATLAACPNFQALFTPATEAEARLHIFYPVVRDDLDGSGEMLNSRPRAIINEPTDFQYPVRGVAEWRRQGNLFLSFEFPPIGANEEECLMNFMNQFGLILADLANLSRGVRAGYPTTLLNIVGMNLFDGPNRCAAENERGEVFYGVAFEITWC